MAKLGRSPLKLKDGIDARSLEELREHGDIESILKHYQEGTLSHWLTVWKHEGELEKIKKIGRKFLENKQECLREIFKNLEIPLDENQFSEYCTTNLGDVSSLFDKDVYKGNDSGVSIKEKLTEFLPKDFSAGQELSDWEVTELKLDEDNVQIEFSCEKEGFSASLEYKKDETLYKNVASMFSFFVRVSALKSEASKSDNNFNEKIAQLEGELQQQSNLTNLIMEDGILKKCDREAKGEVVIPKGVTEIGSYAFDGCSFLASVVLPKGVTKIRNRGFYACTSLTSVVIPEGVTEIFDNAFEGCTSLIRVVIPKSVKKIGESAFEDCVSIISEVFTSSKVVLFKDFVEFFKMYKRNSLLLNIQNGILVKCDEHIQGNLIIPEVVTVIGNKAFNGCTSLTGLVIPKGITKIENYAFFGCSSLRKVVIPEGVTEIGSDAFDGCTLLASVVIPEGVRKIGSYAFLGCRSLDESTWQRLRSL